METIGCWKLEMNVVIVDNFLKWFLFELLAVHFKIGECKKGKNLFCDFKILGMLWTACGIDVDF